VITVEPRKETERSCQCKVTPRETLQLALVHFCFVHIAGVAAETWVTWCTGPCYAYQQMQTRKAIVMGSCKQNIDLQRLKLRSHLSHMLSAVKV
jgi:hypothetical protein